MRKPHRRQRKALQNPYAGVDCTHTNCNEDIDRNNGYACTKHWRELPNGLKRNLQIVLKQGSLEMLRNLTMEAITYWEAKDVGKEVVYIQLPPN